jgi:hypothetical protein
MARGTMFRARVQACALYFQVLPQEHATGITAGRDRNATCPKLEQS